MSDDKTEEPTKKKLDDARRQGQLPQRKNVLEAFILVTGSLMVVNIWPGEAALLLKSFEVVLDGVSQDFDQSLQPALAASARAAMQVPIMALALGFFLLVINLLLTRFNFAPVALTPKFTKLNPVATLKGIFSKNTVYNFIRLMIYFLMVSLFLYLIVNANMTNVIHAAQCGLTCLADIFPMLILRLIILILGLLIILAALDYKIQTMIFISQNKMSKEDMKREFKGMEGDPHIKAKRHQIGQENMYLPSPRDVTHVIYSNSLLVAILYKRGLTPFVVMKAKGDRVPSIQAHFRRNGVKCINLPAVAREFHQKYAVSTYMGPEAAIGMAKVLRAAG
jgi:flagellar biosynthesis protein FlhB